MHTGQRTERSKWNVFQNITRLRASVAGTAARAVPPVPPAIVAHTIGRVRDTIDTIRRHLVPPPIAMYEMLTRAHAQASCHDAIVSGVVDALATAQQSAADLAIATQTDPTSLRRLLTTMASFHFLVERDGRFGLSRWGRLLRGDVPGSMRAFVLYLAAAWRREAMAALPDVVRTGKTGMELAHGQTLFEFLSKNPEEGRIFAEAMVSLTEMAAAAIAHAYPFRRGAQICDVGGGVGILLGVILAKHKTLSGVLVDRPAVVERAAKTLGEWGVTSRCTSVAADFFERVPTGSDVYVLKDVLHDWNDDDARKILQTVRAAMKSENRLVIAEAVISDGPESAPAKLVDLELMILTGGRKRRVDEYQTLLADAGLTMTRVLRTASPTVLIEARTAVS